MAAAITEVAEAQAREEPPRRFWDQSPVEQGSSELPRLRPFPSLIPPSSPLLKSAGESTCLESPASSGLYLRPVYENCWLILSSLGLGTSSAGLTLVV
jgi:hypothetical protein